MEQLKEYIKNLRENSFEGWSDEEIDAYLTALTSVEKKIEELEK